MSDGGVNVGARVDTAIDWTVGIEVDVTHATVTTSKQAVKKNAEGFIYHV